MDTEADDDGKARDIGEEFVVARHFPLRHPGQFDPLVAAGIPNSIKFTRTAPPGLFVREGVNLPQLRQRNSRGQWLKIKNAAFQRAF